MTYETDCIDSDGVVYDLASGIRIGVVDGERGAIRLDEDACRNDRDGPAQLQPRRIQLNMPMMHLGLLRTG